jgi:hypothetical protein
MGVVDIDTSAANQTYFSATLPRDQLSARNSNCVSAQNVPENGVFVLQQANQLLKVSLQLDSVVCPESHAGIRGSDAALCESRNPFYDSGDRDPLRGYPLANGLLERIARAA